MRMFDLGALGAASAGLLIGIVLGLLSAVDQVHKGNFIGAAFYGGLPLACAFFLYLYCKKIKFF